MKKEALGDRLGALLGPSWVDLGTHLGSKPCMCVLFQRYSFVNIDFVEKVRCQDATWVELEATWVLKRLPN